MDNIVSGFQSTCKLERSINVEGEAQAGGPDRHSDVLLTNQVIQAFQLAGYDCSMRPRTGGRHLQEESQRVDAIVPQTNQHPPMKLIVAWSSIAHVEMISAFFRCKFPLCANHIAESRRLTAKMTILGSPFCDVMIFLRWCGGRRHVCYSQID